MKEDPNIHTIDLDAIPLHIWEALAEEAKAVVLPFLRRQPKCKSLKLSRIASVEKITTTGYDGTVRRYYEIATLGGRTFKLG